MKSGDRQLCLVLWKEEKLGKIAWKKHWNQLVKLDQVQASIDIVRMDKMVQMPRDPKEGKTPGPSNVSIKLIAPSWELDIQVMAE